MEITLEQAEIIGEARRGKPMIGGWDKVYEEVKSSEEFKGWKLDDEDIKGWAEIIILYYPNIAEGLDSLLEAREIYFENIESIPPKERATRQRASSSKPTTTTKVKKPSKGLSYKPSNIIDYTIVAGKSYYEVTEKVKKNLKSGWVPQGGFTFGYPGAGILKVPDFYFQAMVKIGKEGTQ